MLTFNFKKLQLNAKSFHQYYADTAVVIYLVPNAMANNK